MQNIENKIVPVLAGVVAYLDTNHNLDLLSFDKDENEFSLWRNKVRFLSCVLYVY